MAGEKLYLQSLTGVRGFAVLLVLMSHAANDGIVPFGTIRFSGAGHYGVFLFFVLSSFLLTLQFLDPDRKNAFTLAGLRHYFLRRILRIYPLFIAALIAYFLLNKIGLSIIPISEGMIFKSLFLLDAEGIFWTVPVEFQYYFILPLIAYLLSRQKNRVVTIIISMLFCGGWSFFNPPLYTTYLIPFVPIFVSGSVSAWLYISLITNKKQSLKEEKANSCKVHNILSLGAMLLFVILIPDIYQTLGLTKVAQIDFQHQFFLFGLISSGFILFTLFSNGIVRKILESRFFIFWGKVSYSAYLGHKVILTFVNELSILSPSAKLIVFFLITAFCSYLSFLYIERPLGLYHHLIKRRKAV